MQQQTITDEEIVGLINRTTEFPEDRKKWGKLKQLVRETADLISSQKDAEWKLRADKRVFEAKMLKDLEIKELNEELHISQEMVRTLNKVDVENSKLKSKLEKDYIPKSKVEGFKEVIYHYFFTQGKDTPEEIVKSFKILLGEK